MTQSSDPRVTPADEGTDPSTHQPLHTDTVDDDVVEIATAHRIDAISGDVESVDPVHHGEGIAGPH